MENIFNNLLAAGLVPCVDDCKFENLFDLAQNVINFLIFLAVPIATIAIVYAGILYVWSAANEKKRGEAKTILTDAAVGLILILGAYLIISTILKALADPSVISL